MSKIPENMHYEITKKVGVIMQMSNGSCKEANYISWGGHKAKMDIRVWDSTGTHPYKGMTLTATEVNKVISTYLKWRSDHDNMDYCDKPVYKAGKYAVYDVIGAISSFSMGFRKELTISSWMNGPLNIELRAWKDGHRGRGDGIALTLEEADNMVRLLISDRDNAKTPKLKEVMSLDCEPHQRKRIRCTFKAGEEIDVIAKISEAGGKPEMVTYIENYAGYPGLDAFIPDPIVKAVKDEAARQVIGEVSEKTAPSRKTASGGKIPSKTVPGDSDKNFHIKVISSEMLTANSFGKRLAASIKQAGISQLELARRAGCSHNTPGNWIRKDKVEYPVTPNVIAAANVLGVKARWLATGKGSILRDADDQLKPEVPSVKPVKENAAEKDSKSEKKQPGIIAEGVASELPKAAAEPEPKRSDVGAPDKTDATMTSKVYDPAPETQLTSKTSAFTESKGERSLAAINECIACLPGSGISNAREIHRMLAGIRSETEEMLLFGSSEPAFKESDEPGALLYISYTITALRNMALPEDVKDDLYLVLSDKRFDIETRMIHG